MFERFTREARLCVEAALEEARALGHDAVGDEDLLLGLLRADAGIAAEALRSLGVSYEAAREEVEQLFVDALAAIGVSFDEVRSRAGEPFEVRYASDRRLPFAPPAKRALERSLREALGLRDRRISGEHVLLGILHDEGGAAVRVLGNLGVSAPEIREKLLRLRAG